MDEWRGLPPDVKALVQDVFGNAQRLQAMVEDESDARDLLLQVAGADLAEEALTDMAAALVMWTVANAASFKRARTRVFQERACFLPASSSGSALPADIRDQLVSSDGVLLRKVHHSRLSQRLADAGNDQKRETLEEEERFKFSLIIPNGLRRLIFQWWCRFGKRPTRPRHGRGFAAAAGL